MRRVLVYSFESYDISKDQMILAPRKATEDTIRRLKLAKLEGTGTEVDAAEVDDDGFQIFNFDTAPA